jgi:hypothetical protein
MEKHNQLKKLILDSDLLFSEKEDLIWFFSEATEDEINIYLNLFTVDNGWIKRVRDNYYSKQNALIADDVEMWDKTLREEGEIAKKAGEEIAEKIGNDTLIIFDNISRYLYSSTLSHQHREKRVQQIQEDEEEKSTREAMEHIRIITQGQDMTKIIHSKKNIQEFPIIPF